MIMEKALIMNRQLKVLRPHMDFCARHGIHKVSLQGEKLSNDSSATEPFKEKLTKELEDFLNDVPNIREHIYNCDETGLF